MSHEPAPDGRRAGGMVRVVGEIELSNERALREIERAG
jgi:hypothetical protein